MAGERHVAVSVVVEALETSGGHWCRACLLPSGWIQAVVVRHASRMHFQLRGWCDECGRRDTIDWSKSST